MQKQIFSFGYKSSAESKSFSPVEHSSTTLNYNDVLQARRCYHPCCRHNVVRADPSVLRLRPEFQLSEHCQPFERHRCRPSGRQRPHRLGLLSDHGRRCLWHVVHHRPRQLRPDILGLARRHQLHPDQRLRINFLARVQGGWWLAGERLRRYIRLFALIYTNPSSPAIMCLMSCSEEMNTAFGKDFCDGFD